MLAHLLAPQPAHRDGGTNAMDAAYRLFDTRIQSQAYAQVEELEVLRDVGLDESEAFMFAAHQLIEEVGERLLALLQMGASDEALAP
eukprot:4089594-Prymnesium_polylepis.3